MRILVVEDEPGLLRALGQALRNEGYAVDLALDGMEGLKKARISDYDAIVLDVMMPNVDGFEVLERLRERRDTTPVMMLTARGATHERVRGLDSGADDYLCKPFELPELLARLRVLIRRSAGNTTNCLQFGEVTVDLTSRTVLKGDEMIPLTAKEQMLVEYLALNHGRWLTRDQLYMHLFDETLDTASNLLDVHVSNVRKKLGADFISTRRGIGYSIAS